MVFYVYANLCSLLAATSQFSIRIGQKMQLTGTTRKRDCADTQISNEWPYCSFPILCHSSVVCWRQHSLVTSLLTLISANHFSECHRRENSQSLLKVKGMCSINDSWLYNLDLLVDIHTCKRLFKPHENNLLHNISVIWYNGNISCYYTSIIFHAE